MPILKVASDEPIGGFVEVGTRGTGMVILNHKDMQVDENGWGYIEFTPDQALKLGVLLIHHARTAKAEKN